MNITVTQNWMNEIPIRMQSTLILALRGPDTHNTPNIKSIARWLRGIAFKPGNPHNVAEFMGHFPERIVEKGPTAKELEFCSQHYYSHLLHALEVVGYRHPDAVIRSFAWDMFSDMCSLLHLPVESKSDFEYRLRQIDWFGEGQPDSFEDAQDILRRTSHRV